MAFIKGCGRGVVSANISEFVRSRCPDDHKRCQRQAVAAALSDARRQGCPVAPRRATNPGRRIYFPNWSW